MACEKQKYVGRDVVMEYVIACGDALPSEGSWKRFGSLRTKEFTLEWETADATADDSVGALRENLATFQSLSISGDGTAKSSGTGAANVIELTKHVAKPEATGGQPVAWIRATFPDLTFTFFAIVTNMSRSAPFDDVVTYSFEAQATGSDFGMTVEDTPDPDATVASVSAYPEALVLDAGETGQIAAIVAPVGAPSGVTYTSSASAVATVTSAGVVTGVSAGTATITVRSSADSTKTDTVAVTVGA